MEANLKEINKLRREIIERATDTIRSRIKRGVPYTAGQLSLMCDGVIPEDNIQSSLNRGFNILHDKDKVRKRAWRGFDETYCIFGSYALSGRIEEHSKTITIQEIDENGTIIRQYKKERPYLTITF